MSYYSKYMKYKNKYTNLKNHKQVGGKIDVESVQELFNPDGITPNPIEHVMVNYNGNEVKLTNLFNEKYNETIYIAYDDNDNNFNLFMAKNTKFYIDDKNTKERIRRNDCQYVVKYKESDKDGIYRDIKKTINGKVIYANKDKGFVLIEKTHPQ